MADCKMDGATHPEGPAALFFDVDGTLVWHKPGGDTGETMVKGRPTDAVYEAFRELKRRGHKTFICTGRPLCLLSETLLELDPTGLVTGAGAVVTIDGKVAYSDPIDAGLVLETAALLLELGASTVFEGSTTCVSLIPEGSDAEGFADFPVARSVDELRALMPAEGFDKVSFANGELPRLQPGRAFLDGHFTICDLGVGLSEMSAIGTNKGAGVRHALAALDDVDLRTFAFGDSENDLPMFGAVEVPVAMGNALPSVKDAAAYVTDAVEDDGVVSALRHFGLI